MKNSRDSSSKKRSRQTSYSQSFKDGESPKAYSLEYEKKMNEIGMITDNFQDEAEIGDDCRELCKTLLSGEYETPTGTLFENEFFVKALREARSRNEFRVSRDLMPLLVPSAELLHIRGATDLKGVIEELNTEWTKCGVIFGPHPKPDFAVGLGSSAFTPDELQQLRTNHTDQCPSYMTADLFFPFLICEVKSANLPLAEAERQTMHSASIAVRALIELYRKVSREQELDQKILVFSVAHDPSFVKIYGHYAKIDGPKLRYFRHLIRSFDFTDADVEDSAGVLNRKDRWTAYRFTRKVYEYFVPKHLGRIRSALSPLVEQSPESEYEFNNPEALSGHVAQSEPSSYVVERFEKPRSSATSMLLEENNKLERNQMRLQQEKDAMRDQVNTLILQQQEQQARQQEQQARQQEQQARQQEQLNKLQDLLVQQKEAAEQQRKEERKEMENQRKEERQEIEQQRKEERQELKHQMEMLERQNGQLMLMLQSKI